MAVSAMRVGERGVGTAVASHIARERRSSVFWSAINLVIAPFIRLWLLSTMAGIRHTLHPAGEPSAHATGSDPDRILLVGNGPAIGFGVGDWNSSLAGHLARCLAATTSRGADVSVIAQLHMDATACLAALKSVTFSQHDVAVITIGFREAVSLRRARRWQTDLAAVLDHIRAESPRGFHTFVLATTPTRPGDGVPRLFASMIARHTRRLNRASAEVVSPRSDATFIARIPDFPADEGFHSSGSYEQWAVAIAPSLLFALDSAAGAERPALYSEEDARQAALESLAILDTPSDERLDGIAQLTRNLFGVTGAAVTFVDRDRLWLKSAAGFLRSDVQRRHSFCDTTITQGQVFTIEDASVDARFRQHPSVAAVDGIRFYAGYPLEGPNGDRIGAFCIFDPRPRLLTDQDERLLRDLALQVQRALWLPGPDDRGRARK